MEVNLAEFLFCGQIWRLNFANLNPVKFTRRFYRIKFGSVFNAVKFAFKF
ncbi:hypothetical protein CAMRE0001_2680 [Campylobacter rectus RM3267]|uniref:Uncharacterized protein n=1 Tax=Campylobacter rectus RM3267 TaxID=553218 RepID=B9D3Y6_CAMRE|nr:hypothetical protein CAMRE0001_2680 [Campylobacter rectus RM3267]